MVGMVVLLVGIMMLIGAVPAAYGFTAQDSARVQAVSAGQEYLDVIRQYVKASGVITGLPPPPIVAIDHGQGFVSHGDQTTTDDFTMTPACTARSLFSFDCSVTVSWSINNGPAQKVQVESYIASQAGF
jgi:hypothetical protein